MTAKAGGTVPDGLAALHDAWNRAWFDKDAATVDRLMTSDYVYVAPNGQVLDRTALLDIIRTPSYGILQGESVATRPGRATGRHSRIIGRAP